MDNQGLHFGCRFNWKEHIAKKKETNRHKNKRDQLGDRKKSHTSIEDKLLIYKAVIKFTWSYGIELWVCASKCNRVIMQRYHSKIGTAIANAP